MKKTTQEKREHQQKTDAIVDQLAAEYGAWFGWNTHIGRYLALGEYILEVTESDHSHDQWLMDARESYLKWKKDRSMSTEPTASTRTK